MNNQA
jgi:hypothetical protein